MFFKDDADFQYAKIKQIVGVLPKPHLDIGIYSIFVKV